MRRGLLQPSDRQRGHWICGHGRRSRLGSNRIERAGAVGASRANMIASESNATRGDVAASDPMARDVPMRRYAHDEVVDAVVVGTGAGGAPVIARLASAGLRVVALEAGP